MPAYRRVYDSRHLQADCQEPGSAPEPYTLGNRVWAIFILLRCQHCNNSKQDALLLQRKRYAFKAGFESELGAESTQFVLCNGRASCLEFFSQQALALGNPLSKVFTSGKNRQRKPQPWSRTEAGNV